MRHAVAIAAVALSSLLMSACAARDNGVCLCAADEKFDGTECVPAADFVADAECTDEGTQVCGCDGSTYTSTCAALQVGVQVEHGGACYSSGSTGDNTGGGFGW